MMLACGQIRDEKSLRRNLHGRERNELTLCEVHLKPRALHFMSRADTRLTVTSTVRLQHLQPNNNYGKLSPQ